MSILTKKGDEMVTEQFKSTSSFFQDMHQDAIFRTTKPAGMFRVVNATFRKELSKFIRYRANFVGEIIRVFIFVGIFYFFSQALILNDIPSTSKSAVFLFYTTAMTLMMYDSVALWSPFMQTRDDLYNGTLEAIYINPSSRYGYFLGGTFARGIFNSIFVIPFLLVSFSLSDVDLLNRTLMILAIISSLAVYMAIGVIIGLSVILWKEVSAVINMLSLLIQFVTGAIIPFASLPVPIQVIGYAFPTTFGLDLIRSYAFGGAWQPIIPIPLLWGVLLIQFFVFLWISKVLLRKVEAKAKKNGLHLI